LQEDEMISENTSDVARRSLQRDMKDLPGKKLIEAAGWIGADGSKPLLPARSAVTNYVNWL